MFGYGKHWTKSRTPSTRWPARMVCGDPHFIPSLEDVITVDNALAAYENLKARGGPCAGVDRVRYEDVSSAEVAACFRRLRLRILSGDYRPQPTRSVMIEKDDGSLRELKLLVILDRVIALMVYAAIAKYIDRLFAPWSFGFRPRRSTWDLLAALKHGVETHGLYVLTHDDIRKAFDNVPVEPLLEVLGDVLPDHRYWALIAAVVRKYDADGKEVKKGIDQGCALSPLLLNVYLHARLDTLLSKEVNNPSRQVRYADNIGHQTRDAREGYRLLRETRSLLEAAGMELKGYNPKKPEELLGIPADLRHRASPLLGFNLSVRNDRLLLEVRETVWPELTTVLEAAHSDPEPPALTREVIQGLLSAIGPALDFRLDVTMRRITRQLREAHLQGAIPAGALHQWGRDSLASWHRTLRRASVPQPPVGQETTGIPASALMIRTR